MSGFPTIPLKEEPIYIGSIQRGDHYHYDDSNNSATEQRPIPPRNCWVDVALIPANPPPRTPWPGTTSGVVTGISSVLLTQVPGNEYRYAYQGPAPQRFENMVPANYFDGAYEPTLTDAAGRVIPYDPTIWVADGYLSVIEFKRATPVSLGYRLPLTMSYWRYDGTFPGPAGGSVTALTNVGTPGGDVFKTIVGSTAELRRISPNTAPGTEGIGVTTSGDDVLVGNTMTGANPSATPGAQVYVGRTTDQLNFRTLVAGPNITLTQGAPTANDITIAATGALGINAVDNVGGGAGQIFESTTLGTAHLRTVVADTTPGTEGISVTTVLQNVVVGNTMEGSNPSLTPSAEPIYIGRNADLLEFRSLVAGPNITLTPTATDITIDTSAPLGLTALANVGGGPGQIFDTITGSTADLRTIIPAVQPGITVATVGPNVVVGTSIVGANPSTTVGAADLYITRTNDQLEFRSLVAGPNITLTQGSPTVNDVTIAAAASVGPTNLALFVSATGNDVTGDGTAGNPYLTLQRAFLDVRDVGYEETCEVTVQAAGGPFALPAGLLPLNQGTKGAHRVPLVIRGERATAVAGVASTAVNPGGLTGFIDVDVAAAPGFALGQILRWTSGPATGQEMFIAEVVSATTVRLPYGTPTPNPGDTFDLLDLTTELTYTQVAIESFGDFLQLHDLKISSAAIPDAAFTTLNTHLLAFGIWWANNAGFGRVDHYEGNLRCGGFIPTAATVSAPTSLGVYFDNTAPGGTLAVIGQGEKYMFNAVCRGNGSPANMVLSGNFPTLRDCYFAAIGGLQVTTGVAAGVNLWFQNCTPEAATTTVVGAVLSVLNNAAASFDQLYIDGSTQRGLAAAEDGEITIGVAQVLATAVAAVYAARGGHVILAGSLTIAANPGIGYHLYDHGRLTAAAALNASSASTGAEGIRAEGSSTITAGSLIASGNALGIALSAGTLQVAGNALVSGNIGDNITLAQASRLIVGGDLDANSSSTGAGIVATQSHVAVVGVLSVDSNSAQGVLLTDSSLTIGGTAAITTNNLGNVVMTRSILTTSSDVDTSDSANGSGFTASGTGSTAWIGGSLTTINNNADNLSLGVGAHLAVIGNIDTSASVTGTGTRATQAHVAVGGALTSNNNPQGLGMLLNNATVLVTGAIQAINNVSANVSMTHSTLAGNSTADFSTSTATGLSAALNSKVTIAAQLTVSNNGGFGITLSDSALQAESLQADANAAANITLTDESHLVARTGLSASNSSAGGGIILEKASRLSVGDDITADANNVANIRLQSGSELVAVTGINANSSVAGSGIILNNSTLRCSASVFAAGNSTDNINLEQQSLFTAVNVSASSSATGSGFRIANGSTALCNGIVTANNNVTAGKFGVEMLGESTLFAGGNLDTNSNDAGISAQQSTITVVGNITANNSPAGVGINLADSTLRASGGLTATNNFLGNVALAQSRLTIVGAVDTSAAPVLQNGITATQSHIAVASTLTSSGSGGVGIMLTESTLLVAGAVQLTGNSDGNLRLERSAFTAGSTVDTSAGSNGIFANESTLVVAGAVNSSANSLGRGVSMSQSKLQAETITADGNGVDNIGLEDGSMMVATLAIDANNAVNGSGILLRTASKVCCGTALTASNNNGFNIELNGSGCELIATSSLTANGSVTTTGILLDDSTVRVGGPLTATGSQGVNVHLRQRSLLTATDIDTSASTGGNGLYVSRGSTVLADGAVTSSNSITAGAVGILLEWGSTLYSTGNLTAVANDRNISATQSNIYVGGTPLTPTSNVEASNAVGGTGITLIDSAMRISGELTAIKNQSDNVSLLRSVLTAAGNADTSSSQGSSGIVAEASAIVLQGTSTSTGNVDRGLWLILSSMRSSNFTFASNQGTNIVLEEDSRLTTVGTLNADASTSGSGVICSDRSIIVVIGGNFDAVSNNSDNIILSTGSSILVIGGLAADGSANGIGITLSGGSTVKADTVSASGNAGTNISMTSDSLLLVTTGDLAANSSAGGNGIELSRAAKVIVVGILTASTNGAANIVIQNGSQIIASGGVVANGTISGSNAPGITMLSGSRMITASVTANNNSTNGIELGGSLSSQAGGCELIVGSGNITATGNGVDGFGLGLIMITSTARSSGGTVNVSSNLSGNISMSQSQLFTGTVTASSSSAGVGIQMANSTIRATGAITASTNNFTNIQLQAMSVLQATSGITASSSSFGRGISITEASTIRSTSAITALTNINALNGIGIELTGGSSLFSTSGANINGNRINMVMDRSSAIIALLSVASATGGNGLTMTDSSLICGTGVASITASNNAGFGISLLRSSLTATTTVSALSNTAGAGISATTSDLRIGGTVTTNSNSALGITLTQSTMRAASSVTATSNTGGNISLAQGSQLIVGTTVSANSAPGGASGILLAAGSKLIAAGNVTADLNGGTNIALIQGSELNCDATVQANGSTTGGGITMSSSMLNARLGVNATLSGAVPNAQTNISLNSRSTMVTVSGIVASSSAGGFGIDIFDSTVRASGGITASSNVGIGINLADAALLTTSVGISASLNTLGIRVAGGGTVRCGGGINTSNNVGAGATQGRGVQVTGGSTLITAGGLTANANRVAALEILSAGVVSQGAISATGSTAGTGITMDKGSLISTTLTATGNSTNGLFMANSTLRADSMTVTGNTGTNVDASTSTIDLSAVAVSSVSSSVNGNGITCNLCKIQIVGDFTASSNTAVANGVGISATSSEISIGGNLTASSNRTAMNLIGTRLRGGGAINSITASTNTLSGIVLSAGSTLTTRGTLIMASNAGIGFSAADSTININGQMSVTASNGTNVVLTQTTLTVGDLVANTSTTGGCISLLESRLEADTTIVAASAATNQTNIAVVASTITAGTNMSSTIANGAAGTGLSLTAGAVGIVLGTLTTTGNGGRGILLTDASLDVGGTLTSTGNGANGGLTMTRANLRCGALATIHGTTGTNVSLTQSTARVAALTASIAASTGTKVLLVSSVLQVGGALTANVATSGVGIDVDSGSELNCGSLALSGNSINLRLTASRCTVTAASTVLLATGIAQILATAGSSLRTAGLLTIGNTAANIPAAIQADNSNINLDRVGITGAHTTPLVVTAGSTCVLTSASGASTMTGGAATTNLVRIASSSFDLTGLTVSGAIGITSPNILITDASRGRLTTVTASAGAQDGIRVDNGSVVHMSTIAGITNVGTGLRVTNGGNVTFAAGTMTITGATDCTVGVNAAKTWAQMGTGQLQHINDYMFPAGAPPALATVSTMSTCAPA